MYFAMAVRKWTDFHMNSMIKPNDWQQTGFGFRLK